jgi:uncharacterized protein (TIGR03083 family)
MRLERVGGEVNTMLDKNAYLKAIQDSVSLFDTAAQRDLRAPIPSCPGWYMATLVTHLSGVERFWAYQAKVRAQSPTEVPAEELEAPPGMIEWQKAAESGKADLDAIPPGLIEWHRSSAAQLLTDFEALEEDEVVWHWSGDNRGITHFRNQAVEHSVHRWDAENAVGETTPIDPAIAADGIQQHFDVQIAAGRHWKEWEKGEGETYHLHRTDGDGEWLVRFQGEDISVERTHGKGDIALRGRAEDLFLWLFGRVSADRLEVLGDRKLIDRYRELAPTG